MIAGASEVHIVGRPLLIAVGRADTRIHVENNCPRRLAAMNAVDPPTGEIGKLGQSESIIQFTEWQQTGIGSDVGTVQLQLETPVEIEPKSVRFRFTRWVRHDRPR